MINWSWTLPHNENSMKLDTFYIRKQMTGARNANDVKSLIYSDLTTGLIIIQDVAPSCGF